MVASSSAFFLPLSPPANGSSIDSDWSTRNRKQPGFLRLISAWYAMVFLQSERGQPEDGTRACSSGPGQAVTDVTRGGGGRQRGEGGGVLGPRTTSSEGEIINLCCPQPPPSP